jgi:hypothetical protein
MAISPLLAHRWIGSRLDDAQIKALATGGVHYHRAPKGAVPPYVIYRVQSQGADENGGGGCRAFSNPLYLVAAVGLPGAALSDLEPLAKRVDERLQGQLHVDGVAEVRLWCVRESTVELPEDAPDGLRWTLGGLYRLSLAHPLPAMSV